MARLLAGKATSCRALRNSDADANGKPKCNAHCHSDGYRHGYTDSNGNCNTYSYSHSQHRHRQRLQLLHLHLRRGRSALQARGYKVHGLQTVDLFWNGATSPNVDVYRNGVLIVTTLNDGFHTDHINRLAGEPICIGCAKLALGTALIRSR